MKNASLFIRFWTMVLVAGVCTTVWAQTPTIQNPPIGTKDGVNIVDDNTVIIQLRAPSKSHVYLRGDFNNFAISPSTMMRRSVDGNRHWLQLGGLNSSLWYRYHF